MKKLKFLQKLSIVTGIIFCVISSFSLALAEPSPATLCPAGFKITNQTVNAYVVGIDAERDKGDGTKIKLTSGWQNIPPETVARNMELATAYYDPEAIKQRVAKTNLSTMPTMEEVYLGRESLFGGHVDYFKVIHREGGALQGGAQLKPPTYTYNANWVAPLAGGQGGVIVTGANSQQDIIDWIGQILSANK